MVDVESEGLFREIEPDSEEDVSDAGICQENVGYYLRLDGPSWMLMGTTLIIEFVYNNAFDMRYKRRKY